MIQMQDLSSKVLPDFGQRLILAMGVFLIILGVRLSLINSFSTDIPYWDQWDGEAMNLYVPYFEGKLSWNNWLQPHNEHRIVLTRIAMFALFLINGQWDVQLQMVMNAIVYSGVGMMLFWVLMPDKVVRIFWGGAVVVIFSLPFGWENTLFGFQLQFYLMIGLSIATLWLLPRAKFGTKRWCLGGFCALLSLFTMASGFLVCAVVLVILLVEMVREREKSKRLDCLPTVLLSLLIVISGMLLKGHVPAHHVLQAHSIGTFLLALAANLSWPIQGVTFWALLQWLPFVLYLGTYLWTGELSNKMTFIVGLGLLVVLQAAATAYARGGGSIQPASRYLDIFSLGVLINLYAMLELLSKYWKRIRLRVVWGLCIVWIMTNCTGFFVCTRFNVILHLPEVHSSQQAALENVSKYIKARRINSLASLPNHDLPYPDRKRLELILDNPSVLKILPPSLVPENKDGRLRIISKGLLSTSRIIFFCGLSCFLIGIIRIAGLNMRREKLMS